VKCCARSGTAVSIMAVYMEFASDKVTLFLMGFVVDELWTVSAFMSKPYQHSEVLTVSAFTGLNSIGILKP
jgi:hypothetical protein